MAAGCTRQQQDESETVLVHQETGPSEANLFEDISIVDPDQAASRQVKPVASLHKVIKFRLAIDDEIKATNHY
ncbi:hypothetical protein Taro_045667 [Colocasia esculenta]|uniref:Uncharacterized protein n=1 Tax=Colocasia esculenta TaxID=4460 RepID=A0A843X0P3_COLES|nr:hypothetical protein [Colocasia esculenta]